MVDLVVPFSQMLPDQPGYRNPGVLRAVNVRPSEDSLRPLRRLNAVSSALTARVLGAVTARDSSGNVFVYAADSTKLYELVDNVFNDESKGGGYTTADEDSVELAVWGNSSKVISTNFTDPVQSIAIGGGSAGAFADMITSTNKPKAKHVGIVGSFVVLGYTNDATDGVRSNRVWWSAIRDEADFDPDSATQCDFDDMAAGGAVQRVIGGADYGLIFQQEMVRTMRYAGAGTVFDLQPLNYAPGTPIPNSVISYKGSVFYIAEAGFMALRGTGVDHIGTGRIDRYFWNQFDPANRRYVAAGIDPVNKIVAWIFPGEGASVTPNRIVMCKYDENKWTEGEIEMEFLLGAQTQGYTLEALDTLGTNIDDAAVFTESLDSDLYKGGAFRFAAFDTDHKLAFFDGATLPATIETGDLHPFPGYRFQINGAQVLVDGGQGSVAVGQKSKLNDVASYGVASEMNAQGLAPLRSEGLFQRCRISLTGSTSWSHVQGVALDIIRKGKR